MTRTNLAGKPAGGSPATERLTLEQAIDAYTRDAAWASFDEHRKGTLERDMLADIVVLTRDIFDLPAGRLAETERRGHDFRRPRGLPASDRQRQLTRPNLSTPRFVSLPEGPPPAST